MVELLSQFCVNNHCMYFCDTERWGKTQIMMEIKIRYIMSQTVKSIFLVLHFPFKKSIDDIQEAGRI